MGYSTQTVTLTFPLTLRIYQQRKTIRKDVNIGYFIKSMYYSKI